MTGLEQYKRGKPAWQDWAYPATWLREKRWLDEYSQQIHVPAMPDVLALNQSAMR
ncbi:MAG: hypothetical protein ETSY1_23490 [Candidatus Entotheonella factor]|uniref:Uncharacterized protein n=1 Tax=Entotheonella factor TaxID=1429438 RepID=W4LH39_ENTF1|nr:MAG: hypothetical protein ETSY1_23490 [Candidatus Entotheonella factor]